MKYNKNHHHFFVFVTSIKLTADLNTSGGNQEAVDVNCPFKMSQLLLSDVLLKAIAANTSVLCHLQQQLLGKHSHGPVHIEKVYYVWTALRNKAFK